jgi:hypothetical protein
MPYRRVAEPAIPFECGDMETTSMQSRQPSVRVKVVVALVAGALLLTVTAIVPTGQAIAATSPTQTFAFTGHAEFYVVPDDVNNVTVVATGGHGGDAEGKGGSGIQLTASHVAVVPGEQLKVVVGGNGGKPFSMRKVPNAGAGGYNGGADGSRGGGGGGGFSGVQGADGNYLVIAGGGGGASGANGGPQNPPGTLNGQNGDYSLGTPQGGGGGTTGAGGYGGHNSSPLVGDGKGGGRYVGGNGGAGLVPRTGSGGGGGGGGYFGGGGGAGSEVGSGGGGGAGSSYVAPTVQEIVTPQAGRTEVTITAGPAAGPAKALSVIGPSTATAGDAVDLTVTAKDAAGLVALGYRGTVHLAASNQESLPSNYQFTTADHGSHVFRAVRLVKAGAISLTATDTTDAGITGTPGGIQINPGPIKRMAISPTTMTVDTPTAFTVEGFDEFGNAVDLTSQAKLRIIPEAGCLPPTGGVTTCIAHFLDAGSNPYHGITAVVPGVTLVGQQKVRVLPKSH